MKILTMILGNVGVNSYIVYDENSKEAILIDPGDEASEVLKVLAKYKLDLKYIVNTHGHADHIGANSEIAEKLNVPIAIHKDDEEMLYDPNLNLSSTGYMGREIISPKASILLEEGDCIKFGDLSFKVIHIKGHTKGGICLFGNGILFSGDNLFYSSIGRADLPGGSMADLVADLKEKVLTLPKDTVVYPGHGEPTTIEYEKIFNPFLK